MAVVATQLTKHPLALQAGLSPFIEIAHLCWTLGTRLHDRLANRCNCNQRCQTKHHLFTQFKLSHFVSSKKYMEQ